MRTKVLTNKFKILQAIRHDAYAEANRVVVEENKTEDTKGTCIHKEACV